MRAWVRGMADAGVGAHTIAGGCYYPLGAMLADAVLEGLLPPVTRSDLIREAVRDLLERKERS